MKVKVVNLDFMLAGGGAGFFNTKVTSTHDDNQGFRDRNLSPGRAISMEPSQCKKENFLIYKIFLRCFIFTAYK